MGTASEGSETRQLALDLGQIPVVPPHPQRLEPRVVKKAWYRPRNEIDRRLRRLKGFRRMFGRFDKLDVMSMAFLCFAFVVEAPRSC